jgi:ribokinase
MSNRPRIAVVGSCNIDLVTFTERLPKPGETMFGSRFDLGFGGKGANQAVAARLCGAEVHMIAKVGEDIFGPATVRNFERLGIDASHVDVVPETSSGVAPIFVDPKGQNYIIVVKGANDALLPADVDRAADILRASQCIVLQLEVPLETVFYTMRFARTHDIKCILNPAPGQKLDLAEVAYAEYFIPNETEAEIISGRTIASVDDARSCAAYLIERGVPRVILTLGEKGALLASRDGVEHLPGFPVATIDTTGAGDAFIGSFATFLGEGVSERDALRRANLYAALSTTGVGTQKSFVDRARFEQEWASRA